LRLASADTVNNGILVDALQEQADTLGTVRKAKAKPKTLA
jgi:hypothetical protein